MTLTVSTIVHSTDCTHGHKVGIAVGQCMCIWCICAVV